MEMEIIFLGVETLFTSLSRSPFQVQNWSHNKLDIPYQNPRRETWGKSNVLVNWH
jgi:hypothetical protein